MPWVILAAALCVLVWFWPRNTLIGLAVVGTAGVLAGIAFWGYGVYDERQRELVAIRGARRGSGFADVARHRVRGGRTARLHHEREREDGDGRAVQCGRLP